MVKLEIGKPIPRFCPLDNTTRAMRFTCVWRGSKVMQILREMILHPRMLTHAQIMKRVYKRDVYDMSHGFFSALCHYGFAEFIRKGRTCLWAPTLEGIKFYMSLPA